MSSAKQVLMGRLKTSSLKFDDPRSSRASIINFYNHIYIFSTSNDNAAFRKMNNLKKNISFEAVPILRSNCRDNLKALKAKYELIFGESMSLICSSTSERAFCK